MLHTDMRPMQAEAISKTEIPNAATPAAVLRTMGEAVDFLRALPVAEHAEPLIDMMEAANAPEMERRAWQAFETFASAIRVPIKLAA